MLRQVNIDGVLYKIGDSRFEGDNLAYIQLPESITVGTPLTDLAPIQKALDSTDGSLLYVPSLNALFTPTASTSPTVRIWASTVGDKGYQLKATLNASGVLQSAVINEAAAEAGLIITDAEWTPVFTQYRGKNPTHFDPTGTYLITDEAKAIANKLITINMAEQIIKSPDKFQIEIEAMLSSFANCVFNDFSMEDMAATFKVLGNVPYIHPMSGNVESLDLDIIGPKLKSNGTIAGLIIKEPQPSEDDIIIEYTDVEALQSATTDPYTPVTTAAAKEIGEKIFNNPRKRIFVHYDNSGQNFYQELKPTAPFPVNVEHEGDFAYIFADLFEDGYNICIRVFANPGGVGGATACPHYMTVSEYALICDNSETTSDPFLTDDVSIWIGKSLGTNCFGLSAAGGTDKVFYKRIVDKADFTGTGATYYDTFTYELDRKFTTPGGTKNYTSLKNINVYYNDSLEVVGILVVDPPKNESIAFNISTEDYDDIEYNTENLTTDPYVTTDLAKSIGKKLLGHFKNPEGFDIDHFTVSKMPTSANAFDTVPISFYTYTNHTSLNNNIAVIKFTTTAEIFNGDITVFYNKSDSTEALGMRIDPKSTNKPYLLTAMNYQAIRTAMETVDPAVGYITDADLLQIAKDIYATKDDFDYFDLQWSPVGPSFQYTVIDLFNYDHAPDGAVGIRYGSNCSFGPSNRYETEDIIVYLKPGAGGVSVVGIAASHPLDDLVHQGIEYMEVPTGHASHTCLEASISGTTLNITHKNESHISSVIHVPKSVLFTSPNAFTLKWASNDSEFTYGTLAEYSSDGINWTTVGNVSSATLVANTLNTDLGKYSMFVRSGKSPDGSSGIGKFTVDSGSNIEISGILEALWGNNKTNFRKCYRTFYNQTGFTSAKNLIFPDYTLASCYEQMFNKSGLITPPAILPATTLSDSCYSGMFAGCKSLTSCPLLPAKTLKQYCYKEMFAWCDNLLSATQLPATTLANYCCRDMYNGCTSLTKATIPVATTLAEACYGHMYMGCTALEETPEFPATTLAPSCYTEMFKQCTALKRVHNLPATTLTDSCYAGMFHGCKSLTTVPKLPATSLAPGCYESMFMDCGTSLKQLQQSVLPATDLPENCYFQMFYNTQVPLLTFPTISSIGSEAMHYMYQADKRIKWGATGEPFIIETTDGSVSQEYTLQMFTNNMGTPPEGNGTPKLNTTYYYTIVD